MKRLRAGIIGLGVGEAHIEGYERHPGCEVAALCDFSEDRLREVGEKHPGARLFDRADELLDDPDIDVVSIASYDNYHYQQVVRALNAGKHVFVEKPLCLYEEEAVGIRHLLRENPGLKLSSDMPLRVVPRFRLLRQMIDEGEMGDLFYVEGDYNYGRLNKITGGWRGKIDFYSVVYGGAVHIIDLLLWLSGDRVAEVAAYGNNISSRGTSFRYNDTVAAILKFESGMVGKVTANYACVSPHFHALSLYGTGATFINGTEYGSLYTSRDPQQPPREITEPYRSVHKGSLIPAFVDYILGESGPEVSTDEVFSTMSVCFAIEKATHQPGPVVVEYI
jgi:predicted dehydrogenase